MIYVDDRIGSAELQPELLALGAPAVLQRLEFGDCLFAGNGKDGTITIGVERKRISDLIASITSKRLSAHQLPGMTQSHDRNILVVEGRWRQGASGRVEVFKETDGGGWSKDKGYWAPYPSRIPHAAISGYLNTLTELVGIHVHHSDNITATAVWLDSLYRWYQKPWESHHSHLAFDRSPPTMLMLKASLLRRIAKELPRIGWERSLSVEQAFPNVKAMVNATAAEWTQITTNGRRLGRTAAETIIAALSGKKDHFK